MEFDMKSVLIIGGVSYDRVIYLDDLPDGKPGSYFSKSSHDMVGGTGAGKALNLVRCGFNTTLHAFTGNDENGIIIGNYITERGIKFAKENDEEGTQRFTNLIDKDGNRISIFTEYNTFNPEFDSTNLKTLIESNDFIVVNIMNYCRYIIDDIKQAGKEIWCDIHDYDGNNNYHDDFIDASDYLFMSSEKMKDYKSFMKKMIKTGKKLFVCTHGKDGASLLSRDGNFIEEKIIEDYVKTDVNGAGDAFFSGFLYAFSNEMDLKMCMRYASITAGLCITSKELYSEELNVMKLNNEYKIFFL